MKHHLYNQDFTFVKEPVEFNKNTDKELLQYCLGGTLYMPGTKDITSVIINKKMLGLTSMVMCFEDAIDIDSLPDAENNVIKVLDNISKSIEEKIITLNDIPLFFLRVRNPGQFRDFSSRLTKKHLQIITGFVFPKFNCGEGYLYLSHLEFLHNKFGEIIYGMPIIESKEIAFKESRNFELNGIKSLLKPYKEYILNVRVGATDFSSNFGVRRGIDYSIYDILTVRDCLSDIINFLGRESDEYVISAPVWEYFIVDESMKFKEINEYKIHNSILKRSLIVNEAIDGLLREVILDKANGLVGKTIIHPSHLKYVNAMQAVTEEEYLDAMQILDTSGGVVKSAKKNKMNEINPHRSWARKIFYRSQAYGVISSESDYYKLFSV